MMKTFPSIMTIAIGIILLLPSCFPSNAVAKEPVRNKRTIPDMQYYVEKNGSFEEIDLEEKPEPIQGKDQWTRDFYSAIKYPPSARSKGVQGIMILTAKVDIFGKVQEVIVSKGLSSDCDAAAITAFLQSTKQGYSPLTIDGATVDFKVDVPVGFWLE